MFRYRGGQTVRHGFYWGAGTWAVTLIDREGGPLPGDATVRYARVPAVLMLFIAPVMGALYVVFLPVVGFALVLDFAARRLWRAGVKAVWALLAAVLPAWRPGEAYLREREARRTPETPSAGEPPTRDETPRREA
jgi:hypothetical protein